MSNASAGSANDGARRQATIDLREGVLGMPLVFEQPNLDNPAESHARSHGFGRCSEPDNYAVEQAVANSVGEHEGLLT